VADLEAAILTGTVTGYFYIGDPDSPDIGSQADLGLINGVVHIKPTLTPPYVRTSSGLLYLRGGDLQVINSVLHGPKPLDGSTTPAAVGATLIATDQAELNPSNFQWVATFDFGLSPNPPQVAFSLPANTTVNLSLQYNPPASTPAIQVVVSEQTRIDAEQAASDAAASAAAAQSAGRNFLVLGPTDPIPANTPHNTVIFRTS